MLLKIHVSDSQPLTHATLIKDSTVHSLLFVAKPCTKLPGLMGCVHFSAANLLIL